MAEKRALPCIIVFLIDNSWSIFQDRKKPLLQWFHRRGISPKKAGTSARSLRKLLGLGVIIQLGLGFISFVLNGVSSTR